MRWSPLLASLLLAGAAACSSTDDPVDVGARLDTGTVETGIVDPGMVDTGVITDSGDPADTGVADDAAPADTGPVDADLNDTGPADTGPNDAGPDDTGPQDTGPNDTGPDDAGPNDAGPNDTGPNDTGPGDAGPVDSGPGNTQMSFFVTSVGTGAAGGNLGGLAGADAICAQLAQAVGSPRAWAAYLSTSVIFGAGVTVNAADRIGAGPWSNANGVQVALNVADLHTNGIDSNLALDENGVAVPTNEHDILTGSDDNGLAFPGFPGAPTSPAPTCFNWTSNDPINGFVWVGHVDWSLVGQIGVPSWNSAHSTTCDQAGLNSTGGSGRIYCFATN